MIKMRIKRLENGTAPDTVAEALQIMKDSGNYPSASTMRRDIERENLPEMRYSINWGWWKFNFIVERYK